MQYVLSRSRTSYSTENQTQELVSMGLIEVRGITGWIFHVDITNYSVDYPSKRNLIDFSSPKNVNDRLFPLFNQFQSFVQQLITHNIIRTEIMGRHIFFPGSAIDVKQLFRRKAITKTKIFKGKTLHTTR